VEPVAGAANSLRAPEWYGTALGGRYSAPGCPVRHPGAALAAGVSVTAVPAEILAGPGGHRLVGGLTRSPATSQVSYCAMRNCGPGVATAAWPATLPPASQNVSRRDSGRADRPDTALVV
jgi:hypothetical protein